VWQVLLVALPVCVVVLAAVPNPHNSHAPGERTAAVPLVSQGDAKEVCLFCSVSRVLLLLLMMNLGPVCDSAVWGATGVNSQKLK
jgi:hypothetical protein